MENEKNTEGFEAPPARQAQMIETLIGGEVEHDDQTAGPMLSRRGIQGKATSSVDSTRTLPGSDASYMSGWIDRTTRRTTIDSEDNKDKASQEHAGFASSLYHHTLDLFSLLLPPTIAHVATFTPSFDKQGENSFKKSLGRRFLWGERFQSGKLKSVLEESESLRQAIVESLAAIGTILLFKLASQRRAHSNTLEDRRIKREIHDLGILVEKARIITESDYESDESSGSTDAAEASAFGIITSIGVYVGCLMELLPSMEETLASLEWEDVDDPQSQPVDFRISGGWAYVLKLYDKFPLADLHLIHRLGEANWQRHVSLRAMGKEEVEEDRQPVQDLPKVNSVAVSEFHDSGLGSSLPARSTYAATAASHSSFQTTADGRDGGSLRVPPTPKEVFEGVPFSCGVCGQFLSNIKNRVDWRRHVFADLKPYSCTIPGCKDKFKTFATRKLWEEHEFGQHRLNRYWACSTCQYKAGSPKDWRTHLVQAHDFPLSGPHALEARLVEVHEPVPVESLSCPLCLEIPGKSQRNFATHVGKHMEGIALAALPRDEESTDTESIASIMSDTSDPRIPEVPSSNEAEAAEPWVLYHPDDPALGHWGMSAEDMLSVWALASRLMSEASEEETMILRAGLQQQLDPAAFKRDQAHDGHGVDPIYSGYCRQAWNQFRQERKRNQHMPPAPNSSNSPNSPDPKDDGASRKSTSARRKRAAVAVNLAPQKCTWPGCDEEFKRPCDLTKHETMHTPWTCQVESCDGHTSGWRTEKELDQHHRDQHDHVIHTCIRSHVTTTPAWFECGLKPCPYQSRHRRNCEQHMEKAHGWRSMRRNKRPAMAMGREDMMSVGDRIGDRIRNDGQSHILPQPQPRPVEYSSLRMVQVPAFVDTGNEYFHSNDELFGPADFPTRSPMFTQHCGGHFNQPPDQASNMADPGFVSSSQVQLGEDPVDRLSENCREFNRINRSSVWRDSDGDSANFTPLHGIGDDINVEIPSAIRDDATSDS